MAIHQTMYNSFSCEYDVVLCKAVEYPHVHTCHEIIPSFVFAFACTRKDRIFSPLV